MNFLERNFTPIAVVLSIVIILLIVVMVWIAYSKEGLFPDGMSKETKELLKYKAMSDPIVTPLRREGAIDYSPKLFEGAIDYSPKLFEGLMEYPGGSGFNLKENVMDYPGSDWHIEKLEDKTENPKLTNLLYKYKK